MSRFVILIHDHPFIHWDLLLEKGATARTWRLLECPARWLVDPSIVVVAEAIGDHRLMYLDYEGPISRERGQVGRWDHGRAEWLVESDTSVRVRLSGSRLSGELMLNRESSQSLWSVRFSPAVDT